MLLRAVDYKGSAWRAPGGRIFLATFTRVSLKSTVQVILGGSKIVFDKSTSEFYWLFWFARFMEIDTYTAPPIKHLCCY